MHPILKDIRLISFDLDGTLIDSVPDLAAAVDRVLVDLELPQAGIAKVRHWVGNGSFKLIEQALVDALGMVPEAAQLAQGHERFLYHYGQDVGSRTRLYPGVIDTLAGLQAQGLILTLVTNKPKAFVPALLQSFGLAKYFSLFLGGDSLPQKKPDPAPLLHVAEHFGVSPAACLMVGDSRHDMTAGKTAGFRTLAVPYGYNHGEPVSNSQPDALVESLTELVASSESRLAARSET